MVCLLILLCSSRIASANQLRMLKSIATHKLSCFVYSVKHLSNLFAKVTTLYAKHDWTSNKVEQIAGPSSLVVLEILESSGESVFSDMSEERTMYETPGTGVISDTFNQRCAWWLASYHQLKENFKVCFNCDQESREHVQCVQSWLQGLHTSITELCICDQSVHPRSNRKHVHITSSALSSWSL